MYYCNLWYLGGGEPTPFLPELPTVQISHCGQPSTLTGTPHGNLRRHTRQLSVGLVLSNSLHRNIRRGTRQLSAGCELSDSPHRNIKRHELLNPPHENLGRHTRHEGSARRVYYRTVHCLGGGEPTPFLPELPAVQIPHCGHLSTLIGRADNSL